MRTHLCLAVLVGLAACSAVDISEELAVMEGATDKVVSNTTRALAPEVARFEREAPLRAARSGERWQLSEECILAERVTDFTSLDACEVIKRPFNDAGRDLSESEIRDAQLVDTQRKLAALQEYMDLLALLNSAKTEEDILLAYGALTGAANNLSREVGSTGVARFAEQLRERKGAAEAVTEFAVENYRARLMRQTVRRAHPAVVDLTGEVKAKLFALGIDQRYTQTYDAMLAANREARLARIGDDIGERARAYAALEEAHARFLSAAEGSIYTQLDQLAAAHKGLSARLSRRPSGDEIHAYLKSLQALSKTLEL